MSRKIHAEFGALLCDVNEDGYEMADLDDGSNLDVTETVQKVTTVIDDVEFTEVKLSTPRTLLHRFLMWNRFVIPPESKLRYIHQINCWLAVLTSMIISYVVSFQDHVTWLLVVSYVCEVFFFAEIYLNFHMAYRNNLGELFNDTDMLFNHYLKGRFAFDMIASAPIDIFALCASDGYKLQVLSYLRVIHLLRIYNISTYFSTWETKLDINILRMRILKYVVRLVLVIHFLACIWFMTACFNAECPDHQPTWVKNVIESLSVEEKRHGGNATIEEVHEHEEHEPDQMLKLINTPMLQFGTSVYWVVATMTSTGYGDVHSENEKEMVFSTLVMFVGKLLFGFILGGITSTLANMGAQRVEYDEKLVAIKTHMRDQKIQNSLTQRVVTYYEYLWHRNGAEDHLNLFYDLPICLKAELFMALTQHVIMKVPLFQDMEEPLLRILCTYAEPHYINAGEFIVRKGDISQELYLIRSGTMEVVSEDTHKSMKLLVAGSYFGEDGLTNSRPRTESVRAVTNVDLFILTKENLDKALENFPETAEKIHRIIENSH